MSQDKDDLKYNDLVQSYEDLYHAPQDDLPGLPLMLAVLFGLFLAALMLGTAFGLVVYFGVTLFRGFFA